MGICSPVGVKPIEGRFFHGLQTQYRSLSPLGTLLCSIGSMAVESGVIQFSEPNNTLVGRINPVLCTFSRPTLKTTTHSVLGTTGVPVTGIGGPKRVGYFTFLNE